MSPLYERLLELIEQYDFQKLDLLVVDTEGYDDVLITNFIQNTDTGNSEENARRLNQHVNIWQQNPIMAHRFLHVIYSAMDTL